MYKRAPFLSLALILLLAGACNYSPTALLAVTPSPAAATATQLLASPSPIPSTPSPIPSSSTIGAPGVGDAYFPLLGNGGYDVQHYTIDLTVDMDANTITGTTTVEADATQALSRFDLDFSGPDVSAVSVDGQAASYTRSGGELTITPLAELEDGQPFTTAVTYSGTPGGPSSTQTPAYQQGWTRYDQGVLVAAEPFGQSSWYPLNETPADKATYTFHITVAKPWVVAANGLQKSVVDNGSSRTYVWQTDNPVAPYLVTLAIGDFSIETDTSNDVLVRNYIANGYPASDKESFASAPQMISYFESVFGPFPFEAYGVVAHNTKLNFALEAQTLTIFGLGASESTAAHELAHSWFGDSLTPARWQDIWLNEGFASFAADLWAEHSQGKAYADQYLIGFYQYILQHQKAIQIGNPGPNDLFSGDVYTRGDMTLHALRARLNDDATFFKILQTYTQRYYHANVDTQDFINIAEEVSGQKLDDFFKSWLEGTSVPDIPELGLSASTP